MSKEEQISVLRKIGASHPSLNVHEVRNIANQLGMAEPKCLRWFKNYGTVITKLPKPTKPDPNFGFASLNAPSNKIQKSTKASLGRQRRTFFWKLPYHKQIAMLKRTEGMTTTSIQVAQELAETLNLPLEKVKVWMKHRRQKQLWFSTNPKMTPEKAALLRAEYMKNDQIDEDQALFLSHLFGIPTKSVLLYYSHRRARLKYLQSRPEKKEDDTEARKPRKPTPQAPAFVIRGRKPMKQIGRFFSPEQLSLLFEEFKRNPSPTTERYNELSTMTGMKVLQMLSWFSKLRMRLAAGTLQSVSESMRANFEPHQIKELERKYRTFKYLSDEEAQNLADRLGVSKTSVMHWFTRRRLYELYKHQMDKEDSESVATDKGNSVDGSEVDSDNTSESPLADAKRRKFFGSLPTAKKVKLLKEYHNNMRGSDVARVARDLNLPENKVRTWYKNKSLRDSTLRKRKSDTVNRVKEVKSENEPQDVNATSKVLKRFNPEQVQILERKFAECDRIMKDEAQELAQSPEFGGSITAAHIQNWYMNTRFKYKMRAKKEGKELASAPKNENAAVKNEKAALETEMTEPAAETPPEKPVSKTAGPSQKSLLQNNILFVEYKKSPNINVKRLKDLSKKARLNVEQVRRWFINVQKRVSTKNVEDVVRILKHSLSITQLKKLSHEYMKYRYCSSQRLEQLAEQLKVTRGIVQNWFINARYYELLTGDKFKVDFEPVEEDNEEQDDTDTAEESSHLKLGLTWPQIQGLKKEFHKDENMTTERARALAVALKIRADKIETWFENRKTLVSQNRENGISEPEDDTIDEPVQGSDSTVYDSEDTVKIRPMSVLIPHLSQKKHKYHLKLPLQQDTLFEAFKQSPELTPSRLAQLCSKLDLTDKQITRWFGWMRKKLSTMSGELLLESYRNKNLTQEQVNVLEAEFKRHPYLDQESRDKLTRELGLNRGTIKMWFANRRYYDIISHSNGGAKCLDYRVGKLSDDDQFEISVEVETETMDEHSEPDTSTQPEQFDPLDGSSEANLPFQPVITSIVSVGEKPVAEIETVDIDAEYDGFPPSAHTTAIKIEPNSDSEQDLEEESEEELDGNTTGAVDRSENSIISVESADVTEPTHYIELLTEDLELTKSNVNSTFWYACSDPSSRKSDASTRLSEADIVVLEAMYDNNPQPDLTKIHEFARRLWVSDQTIYWWFVQKRFSMKNQLTDAKRDVQPIGQDHEGRSANEAKPVNSAVTHAGISPAREVNITKTVNQDPELSTFIAEFIPLEEDGKGPEPSISAVEFVPVDEGRKDPEPGTSEVDFVSSDKCRKDPLLSTAEVEFVALEDKGNQSTFVDENSTVQMNGNASDEVEMAGAENEEPVLVAVPSTSAPPDKNPLSEVERSPALLPDPKHDLAKKKKLILSAHQRAILLQEFRRSPFVSVVKARMLAADLGMSVKGVELWFAKRRRALAKPIGTEGGADVGDFAMEDLTPAQVTTLETEYAADPRLTKIRLGKLVTELQLHKRTILYWFKNKKYKDIPVVVSPNAPVE